MMNFNGKFLVTAIYSIIFWSVEGNIFIGSTIIVNYTLNNVLCKIGGGLATYFSRFEGNVIGLKFNEMPSDEITVQFWVYFTDLYQIENTVMGYGAYDGSVSPAYERADEFSIYFSQKRIFVRKQTTELSCETSDEPECNFYIDTWVHFSVTWQSSTGEVIFYKNGKKIFSKIGTRDYKNPIVNNGCLVLGQDADIYCGDFDEEQSLTGALDDFRIWNHSKTETEILNNYWHSVDIKNEEEIYGLNLYFTFDNDPNDYVQDSSSFQNKALLGGLPTTKNIMTYSSGKEDQIPISPKYVFHSNLKMFGVNFIHVEKTTFNPVLVPFIAKSQDDSLNLDLIIDTLPDVGFLCFINDTNCDNPIIQGQIINEAFNNETIDSASILDVSFNFSVRNSNNFTEIKSGVVYIHSAELNPPNKHYEILEDNSQLIVLGSLSLTLVRYDTQIPFLPSKGTLYRPKFLPKNQTEDVESYRTLIYDTSLLEPITVAQESLEIFNSEPSYQPLDQLNGILVYVPEKNQYASSYSRFGYVWKLDNQISSVADVSISVLPQNDAPSVSDTNIVIQNTDPVKIKLSSLDPDPVAYAKQRYYTITHWPLVGSLHQYSTLNNTSPSDEILPFQQLEVPDVFEFAYEALNGSSQFSRCGFCQKQPLDCLNGSTQCSIDGWHIVNVLGEPNVYPTYLDSELGWAPLLDRGVVEFVEVRFEFSVYPTQIDIYETFKPGAVVALKVAQVYQGVDTEWETIWFDDVQIVPEASRIFSPPICPLPKKYSYLRVELNTTEVPGWNAIDAIKFTGNLDLTSGKVLDSSDSESSTIWYKPEIGVHSSNDFFNFTVTDCENNSQEAEIKLESIAPLFGQLSYFSIQNNIIEDKVSPFEIETEEITNHFLSRPAVLNWISQNQYDISNGWSFQICLQSKNNSKIEIFYNQLLQLPFCLPKNQKSFQISYDLIQGDWNLETWVEYLIDNTTINYRTLHTFQFSCPKDYISNTFENTKAYGSCIFCNEITDAQKLKFNNLEIENFELNCDEVETNLLTILLIISFSFIFLSILIFIAYMYQKKKQFENISDTPLSALLAMSKQWEIDFDDLIIAKQIGEGSFGVVSCGFYREAPVAIKQIKVKKDNENFDAVVEEFIEEAQLVKTIKSHPNVVTTLGVCIKPPTIVIEYVKNGSLLDYIHNLNTTHYIPIEDLLRICHGIAAGLNHLHTEGIIHRDIAARNVLLTSDLNPKITDFGLSRTINLQSTTSIHDRDSASAVGPIRWMAPEALGAKGYSAKTDIWSYGVTVWEIFNKGEVPFPHVPTVQVALGIVRGDLSLEVSPALPDVIQRTIKLCLKRDPQRRAGLSEIISLLRDPEDYSTMINQTNENEIDDEVVTEIQPDSKFEPTYLEPGNPKISESSKFQPKESKDDFGSIIYIPQHVATKNTTELKKIVSDLGREEQFDMLQYCRRELQKEKSGEVQEAGDTPPNLRKVRSSPTLKRSRQRTGEIGYSNEMHSMIPLPQQSLYSDINWPEDQDRKLPLKKVSKHPKSKSKQKLNSNNNIDSIKKNTKQNVSTSLKEKKKKQVKIKQKKSQSLEHLEQTNFVFNPEKSKKENNDNASRKNQARKPIKKTNLRQNSEPTTTTKKKKQIQDKTQKIVQKYDNENSPKKKTKKKKPKNQKLYQSEDIYSPKNRNAKNEKNDQIL